MVKTIDYVHFLVCDERDGVLILYYVPTRIGILPHTHILSVFCVLANQQQYVNVAILMKARHLHTPRAA